MQFGLRTSTIVSLFYLASLNNLEWNFNAFIICINAFYFCWNIIEQLLQVSKGPEITGDTFDFKQFAMIFKLHLRETVIL